MKINPHLEMYIYLAGLQMVPPSRRKDKQKTSDAARVRDDKVSPVKSINAKLKQAHYNKTATNQTELLWLSYIQTRTTNL